jgi:phosphotransferase system enzyme I (PtsI)
MAGDERMTPVLLGFGITELSMNPASLPRVKKRILDLNLSSISGDVRRITAEPDPERLKAFVDTLYHAR